MNKSIKLVIAELKPLNVSPLSMAKYFYQRGITSHLFIQKLIYFAFLESLKDNLLLFTENFQAWKHGPVLRSVFDEMTNCPDLDIMFNKVIGLEEKSKTSPLEKKVIHILGTIYQKYHDWEVWDLVEKSHEGPWAKARVGLNEEEISTNELDLKDLVTFVNGQG